ncbi:MAG: type II toxin-antitoxin system HicA family toxin [Kiritimatiellae bacterium]|nr:type II toxin-antitoxin system HicA family toxin [Kiritimatiellia bacterium]
MKRRDLMRHLSKHGCLLLRAGGSHSVYFNPANNKCSTVPRHREVIDFTAKKICKDLEIPSF